MSILRDSTDNKRIINLVTSTKHCHYLPCQKILALKSTGRNCEICCGILEGDFHGSTCFMVGVTVVTDIVI